MLASRMTIRYRGRVGAPLAHVQMSTRAAVATVRLARSAARAAIQEHELLEEVRLLANIETPTEKLLPIVLAGQPELADRLNQVSLRQLKQRVALRCHLGNLDARETAEYIAGRIRVAGGNSVMVFTRQGDTPTDAASTAVTAGGGRQSGRGVARPPMPVEFATAKRSALSWSAGVD